MNIITDHLDLWSSIYVKKSASGRGRNGKVRAYGIQKLRELILELAVRGKLVPQDPNDEPASVLMERIAEEKAQLVKNGKIKKQKELSELADDEQPFDLPRRWQWSRLGSVGTVGSSSRVHKKDWTNNGVPFYRAREIVKLSQFGSIDNELFITDALYKTLSNSGFVPGVGDLMITGVGTIGTPYIVKQSDKFYFKDASVLIFKNHFGLLAEYLYYFMKSPYWIKTIHTGSMGTTVHTLTIGRANGIYIPLPPLAEQHRIVAKVDELMALCDQLEQQQTDSLTAHQTLVETLLRILTDASDDVQDAQVPREAGMPGATAKSTQDAWARIAEHFDTLFTTEHSIDQLKQTILQLAVMGKIVPQDPKDETASVLLEKIAEEKAQLIKERKIKKQKELIDFQGLDELKWSIPNQWVYARLVDAADIVRGGSPRPAGDPRFYGGDIPFLKVADVSRALGKLVEGYNATIKEEGLKKTRYIDKRTVLLTNSGATLGIPAICDFPATFNDGIAAFVELSEFVFDGYLYLYLKALSRWFIDIASRGQGQPNLNTDIIKATWFALPPLNEQHRIVAKVDELMALCDALKAHIQHTETTQVHLADAVVEQAVA